ncbi:MAG: hypothetical protein ACK5TN_07905 [Acidobacteriota bacterium]
MVVGLRAEVLMEYDAEKYRGLSEFYIASLYCCGNRGSFVDEPIHHWRGATDLADLPLERVAHVRAVVVVAVGEWALGPERFQGRQLEGKAVLVRME